MMNIGLDRQRFQCRVSCKHGRVKPRHRCSLRFGGNRQALPALPFRAQSCDPQAVISFRIEKTRGVRVIAFNRRSRFRPWHIRQRERRFRFNTQSFFQPCGQLCGVQDCSGTIQVKISIIEPA